MTWMRRTLRGTLIGVTLATAMGTVSSAQRDDAPRILRVVPDRLTVPAGGTFDAGVIVAVGADAPGQSSLNVDGVNVLRDGFIRRGSGGGWIFLCPQGRCVPCPDGTQCFILGQWPVDPRTPPGLHRVPVTLTDTRGRTRQTTLDVEVTPPLDGDADGLPDTWETLYGLSPRSASGEDGPDGDPDGDGVRNRDELDAWTAPRGRYRRFFAEASSGNRPPGVSHCFDVASPQRQSGGGWLTLVGDDGRRAVATVGHGFGFGWDCALHPTQFEADRVVAAIVESPEPMIVERSTSLITTHGVAAPASRWLFADGGTDGELDTFYLAYNPNAAPVTARFTYRLPDGEVALRSTRTLAPGHRTTVWVNADEGALGRRAVSVEVESSAPILLERAWRFDPPGRTVTQAAATPGVATPAPRWYLGELDASLPFDTTLVIANPDTRPASVAISLLFAAREAVRVGPVVVPAGGRLAFPAKRMGVLGGAAASVEVVSTNGVGIVAERSYAGRNANGPWRVATADAATEAGTEWTVASVNGAAHSVIVMNPSEVAARLRLDFAVVSQSGNEDSTSIVEVPPRQRVVHELWKDPRVQTSGTLRMTSLPNRDGRIASVVIERIDHVGPNAQRVRPGVLAGNRVR
jgi:hypothetical protein